MAGEDVSIRDATADDAAPIAALYNATIPTTTNAWTEELQSVEDRAAWIEHQAADGFPVLVAEADGNVVGFATYEHFRGAGKWPGYRFTVEHSIHIAESTWRRGVGRALMEALLARARAAGLHVMVGAIDSGNERSIAFHERLDFVEVARMPEIGFKFGQWLDLVLVQRILD